MIRGIAPASEPGISSIESRNKDCSDHIQIVSADYATATIRSTAGTETTYWSIVAFGDAAIELARLCAGDVLAAHGKLKIGTYEKDGQTGVSLSILANSILPLRAPKKAKAQSGAKFSGMPEKPAQPGANAPPAPPIQPEFDDAWPENMEGRGDDWQRCSTAAARRSLGRRERTGRLGHPRDPGDFCMGYKTEAEALADARERNKELSGPGAWVPDDGEEVPF